MAQIQTYPLKSTYDGNDLILVCDKTPNGDGVTTNETRTMVLNTILEGFDVVDKLNGLTGDINITGGTNITVTPSGQNIEISTSASNVDGSGTAGKIPKWSDSNTLTDSVITDQGNDIIIPRFIKREGETTNAFGFNGPGQFLVSVGPSTDDQFSVAADAIIMKTDSGTKLAAGPSGITLYNDENGSTTVSKQSLLTYDSGIIVKGGTENSFARGGAVRFYTSTNDGYVGIKGPTTSGTNYEIILPNAVGTADQVLKLPSTIGSTPYQLAWGDASSITTPISTANGGIGVSTLSVVYNVLIGDGVSGGGNSFTQSGDSDTAIKLPVGATSRRPVASAANVGLIRYNTTLAKFEGVSEGITDGSPDGTYSWVQFSVSP
jgi:hypothetical protein